MINLDKGTMIRVLLVVCLMSVGLFLDFNRNKNVASSQQLLINKLNLEKNIEIIQSKQKDVTGDKVKDKVLLTGVRVEPKSVFFNNVTVVVKNGQTNHYIKATYKDLSGYEPQLIVKDFSGDQIADVMVKAPTGGSGGIVNHLIATFKKDKAQVIFDNKDNKGIKVTGQFVPDFKAKLKFKRLDKQVTLDLSFNREKYIKDRIYNQQGMMIKRKLVRPYSYPYGKLEVVDYNHDGTYELKGYQKVVGVYGADVISELESICSYEEENWELKELQYSNYLRKYNPDFQ